MQKLGQHFLKNKEKIQEIIKALELQGGDTVIEIGPGHGELTIPLLQGMKTLENTKLVAIEKDVELANRVKRLEYSNEKLKVIIGDVRKILPELATLYSLTPKPYPLNSIPYTPHSTHYKLIGNIPYYLTGYLLRMLSELEPKPERAVLTIQKEVSERIMAVAPHTNLLAAITQTWSMPQVIATIPKKDFSPPPKVDSAILKLTTKNGELLTNSNYYQFIKILFAQPRKTIINNLLKITERKTIEQIFEKLEIDKNSRPQNLTLGQIQKLYETFPKD